jgi:hypothetical protein
MYLLSERKDVCRTQSVKAEQTRLCPAQTHLLSECQDVGNLCQNRADSCEEARLQRVQQERHAPKHGK